MEYFLKASAVLTLFYLCFYLILKKETFFQHNRWFLIFGIIISLVFPLVIIPVEIIVEPVEIPKTDFVVNETVFTTNNTKPISQPFKWITLLPIAYGIGLFIFSIQFLFQFGSLVMLLLKNKKSKHGIFTYVIVNSKISPFSFFKWIVYNPEAFDENELELMLTHEKVHAKQLHSLDILITQLTCVVFWFNPFIWLYRKEIRQNLEFIADSNTQKVSGTKKEYQHLLLKTSIANHKISLSNNFYNSSIKERIVMLKKSRSNRKKQWRYLVILPFLAGLLMSMNTEKVYVEAATKIENNKPTIEFVVTKNTTDIELKKMTNTVSQKGGSLVFSKIKRNSADELTNIFVKLYDHSYGGGDSEAPIKSFLIYKELYGKGGGFVGRIEGATLHFNDDTNNKTNIDQLTKRAHKVILEKGLQTSKSTPSTRQSEKLNPSYTTESFKVKFTKDMTEERIEELKDWLEAKEVIMTIKRLKRNKANEIIDISIDFKTTNGSANYNAKDQNGIKPFYFKMDENGSFGVGAINDEEVIIETIKIGDHNNSSKSETFVYNSGKNKIYLIDSTKAELYNNQRDTVIERIKLKLENNDTIFYNSIDSSEVKRLSKLKSQMYLQRDKPVSVTSEHIEILQPNNKTHSFLTSSSNQNPKPLIIVNGKPYNKNISKIEPNTIDKVEVIKGEKAITKYGKDGERGVILIKTNQGSVATSQSNSKENSPWKIERTQIESVSYIDEDDPNKNGNLVYLTKYTSDQILEKHKKNFKSFGINVKYSKLKRNKAGEIISIKITLKTENGKLSSASWKDDNGIPSIEFGKTEGSLIARTSDMNNN